jgi:membrane-bound lytic murein transglycosylase A
LCLHVFYKSKNTRKKNNKFPYPVYEAPHNLKQLKGSHVLKRSAINNGSLKNKGLEIAWVNDMPRLYFLHIQGSGVIKLREGGEIPLVSHEMNGFSFKALPDCYKGSTLNVIKQLHANGAKGHHDMNNNHSYIFFKKRKEPGAVGSQNVQLAPERSAAIDSRIYPYGLPIWLNAKMPFVEGYASGEKYSRLIIAQDRGGAIKGGARLDLFWGRGRRAEHIASSFNVLGSMYVLYPRTIKIPARFDL